MAKAFMKTRNIVITVFVTPFFVLMLLGVVFFAYASYKDSSSKAFREKMVYPAEFEDFHIEEMVVRGPDTLWLFGSYGIIEQLPAVLGTYDGGATWTKSEIRNLTSFARFYSMDDHMILESYEKDADFNAVYVSGEDYMTWDSIGKYRDYRKVRIVRVNDSVPDGRPKYKLENGKRVYAGDFVESTLPIFARNDESWILGSSGNRVLAYRIEDGNAQLQHETSYGGKDVRLEDFFVKGDVFAAVVREEWPSDNIALLYSTDGGQPWKQERVSAAASVYRLDIRDGKIFLAYYHVGRRSVSILTLPIE
jgi:hypothetical protein